MVDATADQPATGTEADEAVSETEATEDAQTNEWQSKAEKAAARAKRLDERLTEAQRKIKEYEALSLSEQEKAVAAAEDRVRAEYEARLARTTLDAAVLRVAAGRLADPDDALRLIDLDPAKVLDEDGKADADAINAAIDALLAAKPYLAGSVKAPTPKGDQGARTPSADKSMTGDDWLRAAAGRR